jgi:tRNA (guanine37-N1)-methyltransferase
MKADLKNLLSRKFEPWELNLLYRSYEIIGDIAVIRVHHSLAHRVEEISKAVKQLNHHVKTVLCQTTSIRGEHRLRQLEWVLGEKKTETIHKENNCFFKVDLARCYFSPRLSYERRRIAEQVKAGEIVINMFSGVGCYSLIIAQYSEAKKVYSIDINPIAIKYQRKNVRINPVPNIVIPVLGDAGITIRDKFQCIADRVLMPLPEKAYQYLDYAFLSLRKGGGWIHYYDFTHAGRNEEPSEKVRDKVTKKLALNMDFKILSSRIVRNVGPRWFQIALDIKVHK